MSGLDGGRRRGREGRGGEGTDGELVYESERGEESGE